MRELTDLPEQLRVEEGIAEQGSIFEKTQTAASTSAEESQKAFSRISEAAGEMVALVRRHNQSMEQELQKALHETAQVEESLITLVTTLTEA